MNEVGWSWRLIRPQRLVQEARLHEAGEDLDVQFQPEVLARDGLNKCLLS